LDQINKQLKDEIDSLHQQIHDTENSILATNWAGIMLDPFEKFENEFNQKEIQKVIEALFFIHNRFKVNDQLATRMDALFTRYGYLINSDEINGENREAIQTNAHPDIDEGQILPAIDLFFEDEEQNAPAIDLLFEDEEQDSLAIDPTFYDDQQAPKVVDPTFSSLSFSSQEDEEEPVTIDELIEPEASELGYSLPPNEGDEIEAGTIDNEDSLSDPAIPPTELEEMNSNAEDPKESQVTPDSKIRERTAPEPEVQATTYEIFAQEAGLHDLLLDLGIDIPEVDKGQLNLLRTQKLQCLSVSALRNYAGAERQYVLIPRVKRFIHEGTTYPCTVKNLARIFAPIFADIKDLMPYKSAPFIINETPEFGWGIIPAEAPKETLDKDFMEQSQYLRSLYTKVGVPSHMVRRRTLVETIYDIIVGRLTLDEPLLTKTLDWTATGPTKRDFIGVYCSEQGLRFKQLNRTQRNNALGLCPNW